MIDTSDSLLPAEFFGAESEPIEPEEILRWALARYNNAIALACSFSLEDVALLHMLVQIDPQARIFALDTGRLPEETFDCADALSRKYGVTINWHLPAWETVEKLVSLRGPFSFKESLEARKECCSIRKVAPLEKALHGLQAWITGQRRKQSATRVALKQIEVDEAHGGIVKLNPLAYWTFEHVMEYVKANQVPYNSLYDHGYRSIGCAPCTRAVKEGEDERAGRWWWEDAGHKECGIHLPSD